MTIIRLLAPSQASAEPPEPPGGWPGLLGFLFPFAASAAAVGYLIWYLLT